MFTYIYVCLHIFMVAQLVKNPPIIQETRFHLWVGKIPLQKDTATHSSILAWRIAMDRGAWWATVHGVKESDMTE